MGKIKVNSRCFIASVGLALLLALSIVTKCALPADSSAADAFWLSFLIICLGACIGALLGALASPFQSWEKDTFKLVAGIASAFVTGFLWKSFEPDIREMVSTGSASSLAAVRLVAFGVAMFLSAFVNYAFRAYGAAEGQASVDKHLKDVRTAVEELEKVLAKRDKSSSGSLRSDA